MYIKFIVNFKRIKVSITTITCMKLSVYAYCTVNVSNINIARVLLLFALHFDVRRLRKCGAAATI